MGYTLVIGELRVEKSPEDGLDSACIGFTADIVRHDDAPAFGDPTDYTSACWPSYSAWAGSMRTVGLEDVFYFDGHLIGDHPGVRLVTPELVERVTNALVAFRVGSPEVIAEYGTDEGAALCRLIWLDYWLRWSLENCETPVIANS